MSSEIKPLTSVRWLAALIVFITHYPLDKGVMVFLNQGEIGLTLFFVLSGFLLTLRYRESVLAGTFSWGSYMLKRIARIWPLYLYILLMVKLTGTQTTWQNWTLTQAFFDEQRFTGIPTAWSLTVEECFYLIAPLAMWRLRYLPLIAIGMYVLGIALVWLPTGDFVSSLDNMQIYTLFGRFGEFAIGMAFAELHMRRKLTSARMGDLLFVAAVAGVIVGQLLTIMFDVWGWHFITAVASGAALYALTCERAISARMMSWRPLVYGGRISYALYLVHMTPFIVVFSGTLSTIPLYLLATMASAALYECVEKPLHRLLLKPFHQFKTRFI